MFLIDPYRLGSAAVIVNVGAWNPSDSSVFTFSMSDRKASESSASSGTVRSVTGLSAGKAYWEVTVAASGNFDCATGICRSDESITSAVNTGQKVLARTNNTNFVNASGASVNYGTLGTITSGQTLCFALDMDLLRLFVRLSGTAWPGLGDPTNPASSGNFSGFNVGTWFPYAWCDNDAGGNHDITINSGQVSFLETPPTGYV